MWLVYVLKIQTPESISYEDAKNQISKLNKHLYLLTEGVIGGYRIVDDEKIEDELNKDLFNKLAKWENNYG